jgi:hypothetical protein
MLQMWLPPALITCDTESVGIISETVNNSWVGGFSMLPDSRQEMLKHGAGQVKLLLYLHMFSGCHYSNY